MELFFSVKLAPYFYNVDLKAIVRSFLQKVLEFFICLEKRSDDEGISFNIFIIQILQITTSSVEINSSHRLVYFESLYKLVKKMSKMFLKTEKF